MSSFKQIPVEEMKSLLSTQSAQILDIRDAMAFNEAHIPNAVHVPFDKMDDFMMTADKSQPVILYCYRGNSSQAAAKYLCSQGFSAVYSLEGGFAAWAAES